MAVCVNRQEQPVSPSANFVVRRLLSTVDMMRLSRVRSQGQGGLINFVPAQIDCRTTLKPRGASSAPTARPISLPLRAIEQEKVQQTSDLKDATARSVQAETSGRQASPQFNRPIQPSSCLASQFHVR